MTPFEAYGLYSHLRLHFTSDKYDVRKYTAKRVTPLEFDKSKVKFKIATLARKYETEQLKEFFIANFVAGDKYGGVYAENGHEVLLNWQRKTQGLTYLVTQDLLFLKSAMEDDGMVPRLEDLWYCEDRHPLLLTHYLGKRINLETLVVLNRSYTFKDIVDHQLKDDIIWQPVSRLIYKYDPFLPLNKEGIEGAVRSVF